MKICLLGAQGTGKSTLVNRFTDYQIIDNVARSVIKAGGSSNQNGDAKSQKAIFNSYEEQLRKRDYLSTRSVIDVLAYTKYLVLNKKVRDIKSCFEKLKLFIEYRRELIHTINWISKNYHELVICYVPIEIPLEDDGVRSMNYIYREIIDSIMKDLFDKLPILYKYIIKGTLEQRTQQLQHIINAHY